MSDNNEALALARKMLHPPEDECCGGHINPTDALLLAAEVVAQAERIKELEAIICEWWQDPDNPPQEAAHIALEALDK